MKDPSVFILLSSLTIGILSGQDGACMLKPFTQDMFKGFLSIFMLDMGILAAERISDIKGNRLVVAGFALILPMANSLFGIASTWIFGLSLGDGFLLTTLCASASYIAVPAAMRLALPHANPSYYLSMALGISFPFILIVGLPLFLEIIKHITI
jgi:uncharacterized protein